MFNYFNKLDVYQRHFPASLCEYLKQIKLIHKNYLDCPNIISLSHYELSITIKENDFLIINIFHKTSKKSFHYYFKDTIWLASLVTDEKRNILQFRGDERSCFEKLSLSQRQQSTPTIALQIIVQISAIITAENELSKNYR